MSISLTAGQVVTGSAQTGLTSPTYTLATDIAPTIYGKQFAVSALGGTQTNVEIHSASKPFTVTIVRPASLKAIGSVNPITGLIMGSVPKNTYKIIVRKGADILVNNPNQLASATLTISVPAGADTEGSGNDIRAMTSFLIGILQNQSAGLGDLFATGLL